MAHTIESYAVIACAKANEWEEALNLIELYSQKTMSAAKQKSVVSVAAVNALIRACGRKCRPDIAVQLLNDMSVRYNVEPDEVSYRNAIITCNQAEHREMRSNNSSVGLKWWECSLSLLRRMSEDGLKPSLQTYSSVISACEAAGEWQRAIGVLKLMPSFAPILGNGASDYIGTADPEPANLYCLNAAIAACEKGGAWVEAVQVRFDPNAIINFDCEIQEVDLSASLLDLPAVREHSIHDKERNTSKLCHSQ